MFVCSETAEERGGKEGGGGNSSDIRKNLDGKLLLERDFRGIACTRSFLHRVWLDVL